ncbi:hypothetical protein MUG94_10885 [Arthrobacter gengyunqii]|uniref:Uncharacterized protein n=1 Tax=Arthrobacter gengyunqii TaxID=2886940 RepID=A0A9X1M281_9MICC|nr:hypothetical protein [Arthrobacter gengyunqii]MCC3270003.1 hypothetical protein [Arthrobacter gengyunqii]UOY95075.1 hypothetical protein MUG94_10885 [Arthrobacter gengyunqii]
MAGTAVAGRAEGRPLPAPGLRAKTETTGKTPVVGSAARISLRVIGGFGSGSEIDLVGAATGSDSAGVDVAGAVGMEVAGAEGIESSRLP